MWASQVGSIFAGNHPSPYLAIVARGCGGHSCYLVPSGMTMSLLMLDLMVAPADWLTLMLMPQFVDMNMSMRALNGAPPPPNAHGPHHLQNGHDTGGFGDLGMYALFKLFEGNTHHAHFSVGFMAPIDDINLHLRRNHGI